MAAKWKGKDKEKQQLQVQTVVEETEGRDIVPGKLSEAEWLQLLANEEAPEVASELVEEIVEMAFFIVYSHYLERQAFPHSTQQARRSLLQIIEWQFLARDEGERDTTTDSSWTEDKEPAPSSIDSWAQGMVPLTDKGTLQAGTETATPAPVHPPAEIPPFSHDYSRRQSRPMTITSTVGSSLGHAPTSTVFTSTRGSSIPHWRSRKRQTSNASRPRPVARRPAARLVALSQQQLSAVESLEREDSGSEEEESPPPPGSCTPSSLTEGHAPPSHERPLPYGMKPVQLSWQKEITYDKKGNIVDMIKLDATKFPSHCVRPRVTVVHPASDTSKGMAVRRTRRAKIVDTGVVSTSKQFFQKPAQPERSELGGSDTTSRGPRSVARDSHVIMNGANAAPRAKPSPMRSLPEGKPGVTSGAELMARESRRFPELPALPALVDTIEPCPGITVREAGRILRGPKSHGPPSPLSPRSNMHPVLPLDSHESKVSGTRQNLEHLEPAVTGRRHVHRVTEVTS